MTRLELANAGITTRCLNHLATLAYMYNIIHLFLLFDNILVILFNWGRRIRTCEWRSQSPLPYHLAIPQTYLTVPYIMRFCQSKI